MISDESSISQSADRRLSLSFGGIVLFLMITFAMITSYLFISIQHKEEDRLSRALAATINDSIGRISFSGKYHTRLLVEEMKKAIPEISFISVEGPDGIIIAHSDPQKNDTAVSPQETAMIEKAIILNSAVTREYDDGKKLLKEIVLPYKGGIYSETLGVVRIGINVESVRDDQKTTLFIMIILMAIFTGGAMVVIFALSRKFGGSILKLALQLKGILEHSALAISISTPGGKVLNRSDSFLKMFRFGDSVPSLSSALSSRLDDASMKKILEMDESVNSGQTFSEADVDAEIIDQKCNLHVSKFPIALDPSGDVSLICTFYNDITARVKAGEDLRRSRMQLMTIIEKSPVGIVVYEMNTGKNISVNERFVEYFGYTLEDLSYVSQWFPLAYPDETYRKEVMEEWGLRIHQSVEKGVPFIPYEVLICCKDRTYKHVLISAAFIETICIVTFVDITAQKKAEQALKKSEDDLRKSRSQLVLIIEKSPIGIAVFDREKGNNISLNDKFVEYFGYTLKDVPNVTEWEKLAYPDEKYRKEISDKWLESVKRCVDKNMTFEPFSVWVRCADESRKLIQVTASFLEQIGIVTFVDLTAQKKAEEALLNSERSFSNVFKMSPEILAIIRKNDTLIIAANPVFTSLLGYEPSDYTGKTMSDLGLYEDAVEREKISKTLFASGELHNLEVSFRQKNGEMIPCLMSVSSMVYSGEDCYLFVAVDVRKLKETESFLKASITERETLLQELYHRTKNNMQVISSLLNIQSGVMKEEKTSAVLKDMANRIHSMALVHQKLYQSKSLSAINLKSYTEELVNFLLTAYSSSSRNILFEFESDDVLATIDTAVPYGLVINELVSNALKYAFDDESGGKISMRMKQRENRIIDVIFADNGKGLPDEFNFRETQTLGMKIITGIIESQLEGSIEPLMESGTAWKISFKVLQNKARV